MPLLINKNATCEDILCCLFNLRSFEIDIFYRLATSGPSSVDEIAEKIGKDRTTVHRILSKLTNAGLCYRETVALREGGYYHIYFTSKPEEIKNECKRRLDLLMNNLRKVVSSFEENLRNELEQRTRYLQ